jgi:antitoxin FitA
MSKTIEIRDVSDRVYNTFKARAAREGMSLSDFLKRALERTAGRASMREWLERIQQPSHIAVQGTAAGAIRELRDAR